MDEASSTMERLDLDEAPYPPTVPEAPTDNMPRVHSPRPQQPRRSTEPPTVLLSSEGSVIGTLPLCQQRNRSPYSRSHLRSRSGNGNLSAPQMARARSLPSVTGHSSFSFISSPTLSPASPLRSPARMRSPNRPPPEESYPPSTGPNLFDIDPISEDSELDLTPRANYHDRSTQSSPLHATFPRIRRRPASPLSQTSPSNSYSFLGATTSSPTPTSTSFPSSPRLAPTRYNEPFPGSSVPSFSFSAPYSTSIPTSASSSSIASSVPSTPSSTRSRSPSISSLETIPDSPDAEAAALLADAEDRVRIAQLKAAADAADKKAALRRGSFNVDVAGRWGSPGAGGTSGLGGMNGRDKRKRWSVCGAERRGDLDLETIWED
ncbi:hypothetical protein EV356DRAFT_529550 [Viridothelium virens]|uniref:Basic proline-rich protein n=1 Tax=Viridothelium virens TaxID=1048519 RepID=A0A6A6HIX2_VIRVR|nr:hypothetical protein EV356DRAFT_529550 [Viridothelium virens]